MDWTLAAIAFGVMLVPVVVFSVIYCINESKRQTLAEQANQPWRDAKSEVDRCDAALEEAKRSGKTVETKLYLDAMDAAIRLHDLSNPPAVRSPDTSVKKTTHAEAKPGDDDYVMRSILGDGLFDAVQTVNKWEQESKQKEARVAAERATARSTNASDAELDQLIDDALAGRIRIDESEEDEQPTDAKGGSRFEMGSRTPPPPTSKSVDSNASVEQDASHPEGMYDLRHQYRFNRNMFCGIAIALVVVCFVGSMFDPTGIPVLLLAIVPLVLAFRKKKWPMSWSCPRCGKTHTTTKPWRCGFCNEVSTTTSFFEGCSNSDCGRVAKAYECPYEGCGCIVFLDQDDDGRHAARKDTAPPMPIHRADETVRATRQSELDELEHRKRKLEYDIKLAELGQRLKATSQEKRDPKKDRIGRIMSGIEEAVEDCSSIQEAMKREKQVHAKIERDTELDAEQKAIAKKMASMKFDDIRYELSRNVRT